LDDGVARGFDDLVRDVLPLLVGLEPGLDGVDGEGQGIALRGGDVKGDGDAGLRGENAVLETFSATPEIYSIQYEEYARPLNRLRHLASCGCMVGDVSEGTVRTGPAATRSTMTYDVVPEDVRVHKKGIVQIAEIYFAAGALEVHPGIIGGGTFTKLDAFAKFVESAPVDKMNIYASHPMGTCRMSGDKKTGVVKPTGETWDVEGLYVSDASVFPTSLGVNPQITVMSTSVQIARQALQKG
jgi:long-chain-alcohol oxidase